MAMPLLRAITIGEGGEADGFTYILASLLQDEAEPPAVAITKLPANTD